MTRKEREAREQIGGVLARLEAQRDQLAAILASLPEAPEESDRLADLDELEGVTEIRSVIRCVLQDCIDPGIRDLRDVARLAEGED